jgi:hypothetical protein
MDEELVKRVARAAGRAFSEVTDGAILSTVETEAMALAIIPLVGEFCAGLAEAIIIPFDEHSQCLEHGAFCDGLDVFASIIRAATTERNEDAE